MDSTHTKNTNRKWMERELNSFQCPVSHTDYSRQKWMAGWQVADEVEGTQKERRDDDNAEDLDNDYHIYYKQLFSV